MIELNMNRIKGIEENKENEKKKKKMKIKKKYQKWMKK